MSMIVWILLGLGAGLIASKIVSTTITTSGCAVMV